jgi:hypothetical protein
MAGEPHPTTIELVDVSGGGGCFRTAGGLPRLGQQVAFGFVTEDRSLCTACGRVVRVDPHGFALKLERSSPAFRSFVQDVSGPLRIGD